MVNHPKAIGLTAFGVTSGFALLFVACALENVWWPLMVLVPYLLIPVPLILLSSINQPGVSNTSPDGILYCPWTNWGQFLTGTLATCTFAMHGVFAHLKIISLDQLGYAIGSNILIFLSIIVYGWWSSKQTAALTF